MKTRLKKKTEKKKVRRLIIASTSLFLLLLFIFIFSLRKLKKKSKPNFETNTNTTQTEEVENTTNYDEELPSGEEESEETESSILIKNATNESFSFDTIPTLEQCIYQYVHLLDLYRFLFGGKEVPFDNYRKTSLEIILKELETVLEKEEIKVDDLTFLNHDIFYLILPSSLPLQIYFFFFEKSNEEENKMKEITTFFLSLKKADNNSLSEFFRVLELFGSLFGFEIRRIRNKIFCDAIKRKGTHLIIANYIVAVQNYAKLLRITYGRKYAVSFINRVWEIMTESNTLTEFKSLLVETVGYQPLDF